MGLRQIQVLGQKVALRPSGADAPGSRANEVIEFASARIREAEGRTKSKTATHVLILALLDLCEEYLDAKDRVASEREEVQQKVTKLLEALGGNISQ